MPRVAVLERLEDSVGVTARTLNWSGSVRSLKLHRNRFRFDGILRVY